MSRQILWEKQMGKHIRNQNIGYLSLQNMDSDVWFSEHNEPKTTKKLWIFFEACWSPWCCFFSSTAPGHSKIILEKSNGQTRSKPNLHVTSLNW